MKGSFEEPKLDPFAIIIAQVVCAHHLGSWIFVGSIITLLVSTYNVSEVSCVCFFALHHVRK